MHPKGLSLEEKQIEHCVRSTGNERFERTSKALDLSAWKGCERLATDEAQKERESLAVSHLQGAEVLKAAKLYGSLKAALTGTGATL